MTNIITLSLSVCRYETRNTQKKHCSRAVTDKAATREVAEEKPRSRDSFRNRRRDGGDGRAYAAAAFARGLARSRSGRGAGGAARPRRPSRRGVAAGGRCTAGRFRSSWGDQYASGNEPATYGPNWGAAHAPRCIPRARTLRRPRRRSGNRSR
ncbi:hypothetical protein EVAR_22889_1 [Eumeta japonica]|uniref:Uncharacterized protein n=1 Tax=Eumeta variegata TaxID=151549 RepID=A0A4C1UUL6_EUMVA|nr:hypothetical protein EVAR_22889_1 [Eumeta japonica]